MSQGFFVASLASRFCYVEEEQNPFNERELNGFRIQGRKVPVHANYQKLFRTKQMCLFNDMEMSGLVFSVNFSHRVQGVTRPDIILLPLKFMRKEIQSLGIK